MLAVIYVRISRDREGAGLGVERQRDDCTDLAERLGWTVVSTYTDNDISAYSGKRRPGYEQMLTDLDAGKAQAVITWHTDRLHRRPIELEAFIDLCDRRQIAVQTVKAGTVDLSTPSGRMVARMLGAAARHEVEHSVQRAKRAKEQAALAGKFRGGRRAFGYEPDGMALRPDEANAIRAAAQKVLAGISLSQIAREWNEAGLRTSFGGKPFRSIEVRKVLLRPRNAGIALHEGKPVADGQWQAILDKETFAALDALLRDPDRKASVTSFERRYQGTNVYVCGLCGAPMAVTANNRTGGGYRRAYACTRVKHVSRAVDHLDAFVDAVIVGRLSQPDARIMLGGPAVETVAALRAQRDGLRSRLDELGALFADGSIDGSQLKRGSAELRGRLERVESELATARSASAVAELVLSGDDLAEKWSQTSPDVRGKVIAALADIVVMPAGRGRQAGGGYFNPASVSVKWRGYE